jgi:hypothetical protein
MPASLLIQGVGKLVENSVVNIIYGNWIKFGSEMWITINSIYFNGMKI